MTQQKRKHRVPVTFKKDDYLDLVLARQAIEQALSEGRARVQAVAQEEDEKVQAASAALQETLKQLAKRYPIDPSRSYRFDDARYQLVPEKVQPKAT